MQTPPALAHKLATRAAGGTLRRLPPPPDPALVDFASNDYLGVVRGGQLAALLREKLLLCPILEAGSTGSRLLTGNSAQAEALEARIGTYHRAEAALLFATGYCANLGFFSAVPQRGDTVLYDEAVHASVRDGLRLGLAQAFSFRHNDLTDLEKKLRRATGVVYVAVESLYSMDGDEAPLRELATLCQQRGLFLVVDEAHTTGVRGPGGAGLVVELGLEHAVFARLVTFGKALGAAGAAWLGSTLLRDYLINFARAFVFSTAPLPLHLLTLEAAYDLLPTLDAARARLAEVSDALAIGLTAVRGLVARPASRIVHAVVPLDQSCVRALAAAIRVAGFDARPIFPPTVAPGTARLRVIAHAHNAVAEADALLHTLGTSSLLAD